MKTNRINSPVDSNMDQFTEINGIKFTPREIDVISLIIHVRGASKISSLLSISTRTVETHTANIMRKMNAHSREGIIDFAEREGHLHWIDQHYQNLLIQKDFKKLLGEISNVTSKIPLVCIIIYENEEGEDENLVYFLKEHLNLCGIRTVLHKIYRGKPTGPSFSHKQLTLRTHVIYKLPQDHIKEFQVSKVNFHQELTLLVKKVIPNFCSLTIIVQAVSQVSNVQDLNDLSFISFGEQRSYFSAFLKILEKIIPEIGDNKTLHEFVKSFEKSRELSQNKLLPPLSSSEEILKEGKRLQGSKLWLITISIVTAIFLSLGLHLLKEDEKVLNAQVKEKSLFSVRSDLVVPNENTLIKRSHIISRLEDSLKSNEGIQSVALTGIGGAGKTTIARQFARTQDVNIVWEMNATTQETLKNSFENLAYALCKSEEEKNVLIGLQNIKNKVGRDEKILLFVKENLRNISNWLLIFDNLEKFSDIQKYFPCDPMAWGNGKIIVTTSDANIKNNCLIRSSIEIGELSPQEKLTLFSKIMTNKDSRGLTPSQEDEAKNFLNSIPPFPLDVSIAGYYLKSTNTPSVKYLEYLKENSKDFEFVQTSVLKEASDYTKTRYRIISMSLKQLIDTHKDFSDLLLLISFLSSQNIPKSLLSSFKNDAIVDNFIYHLKKYSFITAESFFDLISTISIHRNIQEMALGYLMKTLSLPGKNELLDPISNALEDYIVDAIDKEDFAKMKLLVPHCETFISRGHLITEAMRSSIGGALGCIYYYLRHNHKAKQLLEENLHNLKKHQRKKNVKIARILTYLGNFYRAHGDYQKAKELLEQSLSINQKQPQNIRRAKALGYLGAVYRDLGNYQNAKVLYEQSLLIYKEHSKNTIGHAWILAHLGNINMILGDYLKAKILLEQSLAIYRGQAEDYVGVAWVLCHLGTVYKLLGDYERARRYLEQSLLITRKYFSDDHIFVASVLSFLASVHIQTGHHEEAKSMLEKSLAIYEKNYGKNHIETARVLRMLGQAYCVSGDIEIAEDTLNQSLIIFQQKKHPEAYKSLEGVADLHLKRATQAIAEGDERQAHTFKMHSISYLYQALKLAKDHFPEDSQHILRVQEKLKKIGE